MTTKTRDNSQALDVFMAKKAEFDELLARLQQLSDDHFNAMPEEVDGGHAGQVSAYVDLLRRVTDWAFGEGECAS